MSIVLHSHFHAWQGHQTPWGVRRLCIACLHQNMHAIQIFYKANCAQTSSERNKTHKSASAKKGESSAAYYYFSKCRLHVNMVKRNTTHVSATATKV